MIREARLEAIEFMEKEGILRRLMDALKDLAKVASTPQALCTISGAAKTVC